MNLKDYLIYGFDFIKEDSGYSVIADYLSGATCGKTYEDALVNAKAFLLDNALFYFQEGRLMPEARPLKGGQVSVNIGYDNALKIMLRNLMTETRTRPAKLASLLQISPQSLNQNLRFDKSTKLDTLAKAFEVLGKPLQISVS